jgi:hypothetical protein
MTYEEQSNEPCPKCGRKLWFWHISDCLSGAEGLECKNPKCKWQGESTKFGCS